MSTASVPSVPSDDDDGLEQAPVQVLPAASPRELRGLMKDWRRGRATRNVGQALSDAYVAVIAALMIGAMTVNVILKAQRTVAQCDSASCLSARTMMPWAGHTPPVLQQAAAPATTPFGLWQTEEGNVRVEQCGANLCGYGEKDGKKSNELVLINMKPSSDNSKWTGRIHDPSGGNDYDSIIAMKGPNLLSVKGCAFGGLFCGNQTWKRVS